MSHKDTETPKAALEPDKLVRHVTPLNPDDSDQLVWHDDLGDWPTIEREPTPEEAAEAQAKKSSKSKASK